MTPEKRLDTKQYTNKDLGFDPAEVWIVNTLDAIAKRKIVTALWFTAVLLSALAIQSSFSRNMDNSQIPTVTITRITEEPASKSLVQLAQERLDQLQDSNGRSFKQVMADLGHQVGNLQDVGYKSGVVGGQGLLRRYYPAAEDPIVVFKLGKWLGFGLIDAGEEVAWDGEVDVLTGSTVDRFAHRIPDLSETGQCDEYFRLGQRVSGESWNSFVTEK